MGADIPIPSLPIFFPISPMLIPGLNWNVLSQVTLSDSGLRHELDSNVLDISQLDDKRLDAVSLPLDDELSKHRAMSCRGCGT
jgi:hypothetical protein